MKLNRNVLVLAAIGVVIFVFLGLIFRPLRKSAAFHRDEVANKRAEITKTMELTPKFTELKSERERVQDYINKQAVLLPQPEEIAGVLGSITTIAAESKIRILNFTPQPRVNHEALGQTELSLKASGQFAQIHDFVNRLEQLAPAIWIRRLTLTRIEEGAAVSTEISLVIFSSEIDIADSPAR